jgi:hypothetical protein
MVQAKTIVLTNDPVSHRPSKHLWQLCTQGACSQLWLRCLGQARGGRRGRGLTGHSAAAVHGLQDVPLL